MMIIVEDIEGNNAAVVADVLMRLGFDYRLMDGDAVVFSDRRRSGSPFSTPRAAPYREQVLRPVPQPVWRAEDPGEVERMTLKPKKKPKPKPKPPTEIRKIEIPGITD